MNNTGLLLATRMEATALLEDPRLHWIPQNESRGEALECYIEQQTQLSLCITGIGPVSSAYRFGLFQSRFKCAKYLNLGIAGALKEGLALGEVLEVTNCCSAFEHHPFDRRWDHLALNREGQKMAHSAVCLSVGEALHDERLRRKWAKKADIVDMECYALAYGALNSCVELRSFKIISDFAQAQDAKEILRRIPALMQSLWSVVSREALQLP